MPDAVTRRDPVSLVAGVVVLALGGLLLADDAGGLDLRLEYALPAVLAAAGLVLLVLGLTRGR